MEEVCSLKLHIALNLYRSGLGIRGDREANLVVAPPVDGGREGQRTEVVEGPVHRVVLQLEGDGLIPEAGPGSIPLTTFSTNSFSLLV